MVKTRTMRKKNASRNNSYARRVRKSPCRSKGPATCRRTSGCKYSSGKKRSFCRKNKNTKRRMKGGSSHYKPHTANMGGAVLKGGSSHYKPHTANMGGAELK